MSPQRHSTPAPATNLQILAGDLLAVAAKRIAEQLACVPDWEPMRQLKQALETYELARTGDAITNAQARSVTDWETESEPKTLRTGEVANA